jgi:ABC-type sugar transport system ATPase subunit
MAASVVTGPALDVRGVTKRFPGVTALDGVSLTLRPGSIHALVGQNGAGKSTLIEILAGRLRPDAGEIRLFGEPVEFRSIAASLDAGIAAVHQELSLVGGLSVAENLALNRAAYYRAGLWQRRRAEEAAAAFMQGFPGMESIPPGERVSRLSVAQRQLVEIARALMRNSRILVLDEPTASLSQREVDALFRLLEHLRDEGRSILLVTHKLDEVFRLADRVTVLRDGRDVLSDVALDGQLTPHQVIEAMIGRRLATLFPKRPAVMSDVPLLEVRDLVTRPGAPAISFSIRAGEIVALVGLVGSGRTRLMRVLGGIDQPTSGEVRIAGRRLRFGSPAKAVSQGVFLVPDDRKLEGLILDLSVEDNLSLPDLARKPGFRLVNFRRERALYRRSVEELQIRVDRPQTPAVQLSGGNQQKMVIGKWLVLDTARVVLMDEPTKGIDIAAKADVYEVIARLAENGLAVLIVPSEMDEALELPHRVLIMAGHRIAREVNPRTASSHSLYRMAAGLEDVDDAEEIDG